MNWLRRAVWKFLLGGELKYYSKGSIELRYGTEHSAGIDLPYYSEENLSITINPGETAKLPSGIFTEIPVSSFGFLDSRSSTSKKKLDLLCRTIDCDYRGEIFAVMINLGTEPVTVSNGDRLVQLIVLPYFKLKLSRVDDLYSLTDTKRGTGGFGHTGQKY